MSTTIELSEQEYDLINAMRNIKGSQDDKYEVHVITKYQPSGYVISEYRDEFTIGDDLNE